MTQRFDPFAGPSSVTTLPLRVIVDGTDLAAGLVTIRNYGHEPETLSVPRFAAAVRAQLLELAHELAVNYGIDSDHLEEIMSAPRDELTHDDIDIRFGFHTAAGRPDVGERHDYVRYLCRELAHALLDQLPAGPDKRLAIEALEDVMMRSNRAIALGFREPPAPPPPITRPVPRPPSTPPSAYQASRPQAYRGGDKPVHTTRSAAPPAVPKPREAGDDKPRST